VWLGGVFCGFGFFGVWGGGGGGGGGGVFSITAASKSPCQ